MYVDESRVCLENLLTNLILPSFLIISQISHTTKPKHLQHPPNHPNTQIPLPKSNRSRTRRNSNPIRRFRRRNPLRNPNTPTRRRIPHRITAAFILCIPGQNPFAPATKTHTPRFLRGRCGCRDVGRGHMPRGNKTRDGDDGVHGSDGLNRRSNRLNRSGNRFGGRRIPHRRRARGQSDRTLGANVKGRRDSRRRREKRQTIADGRTLRE